MSSRSVLISQDLIVQMAGGDDAVHVPDLQGRQRPQRHLGAGWVQVFSPGGRGGSAGLPGLGQRVGRIDELGAKLDGARLDGQRRQGIEGLGCGRQRKQRILVSGHLGQALHHLAIRYDGFRPVGAKEHDLPEAFVVFIGKL
jgi:hypothetical protein